MKGITYCGACADYDLKKHRCKRGAKQESNPQDKFFDDCPLPTVVPVVHWIPVTEQLPESNHKNDHVGDVLCFVPPRDDCYQSGLYLGKPKHVAADDGSGNFWGRPMQASDWTLWSWIYLEKPVVTHWMPLPEPPKMDGGTDNG